MHVAKSIALGSISVMPVSAMVFAGQPVTLTWKFEAIDGCFCQMVKGLFHIAIAKQSHCQIAQMIGRTSSLVPARIHSRLHETAPSLLLVCVMSRIYWKDALVHAGFKPRWRTSWHGESSGFRVDAWAVTATCSMV